MIATHITSDIEDIADKIIMIKEGELIAEGKVSDLINNVEAEPKNLENLYLQYYGEKGEENDNEDFSL